MLYQNCHNENGIVLPVFSRFVVMEKPSKKLSSHLRGKTWFTIWHLALMLTVARVLHCCMKLAGLLVPLKNTWPQCCRSGILQVIRRASHVLLDFDLVVN